MWSIILKIFKGNLTLIEYIRLNIFKQGIEIPLANSTRKFKVLKVEEESEQLRFILNKQYLFVHVYTSDIDTEETVVFYIDFKRLISYLISGVFLYNWKLYS